MNIVCLFLAQSEIPNPPHVDLGFLTQAEAFERVAEFFGSNQHTVKLTRDAFDRYTDSPRVGWDNPLRSELQKVWTTYSGLGRAELLDLTQTILARHKAEKPAATSALPDLGAVIAECRVRLSKHDLSNEINVSQILWSKIIAAYQIIQPTDQISIVGNHTIKILTPSAKNLAISCQELPQCWSIIPYINALRKYEQVIDELALALGYRSRTGNIAQPVFGHLPSANWRQLIDPAKVQEIDNWVAKKFVNDPISMQFFERFLSEKQTQGNPTWSAVSKDLDRNDWIESAAVFVGGWLAVGAERRPTLAMALALDPAIDKLLEAAIEVSMPRANEMRLSGGENIIYYGAPGTGKSHAVEEQATGSVSFRTVFHSDMQNSDFIGTLKPAIEAGNVSYRFQPGPFSRALSAAWNKPNQRVYLIIEEINRAMAAAVFGEIFQLLDRTDTGASKYTVDFPSPEFFQWFNAEGDEQSDTLELPSNLWILATMNSADQGVYPIDTAFRRRWKQIYVPIDYEIAPQQPVSIFGNSSLSIERSWSYFVRRLNEFLIDELRIAEDRLVGPRFLSAGDLVNQKLPGKLLIYLWDDLLRHHERDMLFAEGLRTYGELHKANEEGRCIFSDKMLAYLGVPSEISEGQSY